jgi:hypothetical protein
LNRSCGVRILSASSLMDITSVEMLSTGAIDRHRGIGIDSTGLYNGRYLRTMNRHESGPDWGIIETGWDIL